MAQLIWSWFTTALDWCTADRVIALATIVYALVTIVMFFAIRSQAKAAHRQADIARDAATAAEKSADALINSERAWIVVDDISPPPEVLMPQPSPGPLMVMTFGVRFKNCGRTIARPTDGRIRFHTVETTGGLPPIPDYGAKGDVHGLPPGRIIAPNQTFGGGALLEETMLSHEQITAIKQHTLSLYFYGFIAYRDFVGDDHEMRFCYVYRFPTGLILKGLDKDEFIPGGPEAYNQST